jgi:hypothetical protein
METEESKSIFSEIKTVTLERFKVERYKVISNNPEGDSGRYIDQWAEKSGLLNYKGYTPRRIGWDCEVTQEQQKNGLRGYASAFIVPEDFVPNYDGAEMLYFEKDTYVTITITDPFSDPFVNIPKAYKMLINFAQTSFKDGMFEEIYEAGGVIYMDVYVPIDK